ncbi:MAG: cupin domain-containing protein [Candidatus Nanoarchaeia archaeon]
MIEDILKRLKENKRYGNAEIKIVPKDWGQELWIINNEHYCGKILEINKGWCASLHYHGKKDETFLLYDGLLLMEHPKNEWVMYPGNVQRIRPGETHRFTALEHSVVIEFSTHHDDSDTTRFEVGKKVDLNKLDVKYRPVKKK